VYQIVHHPLDQRGKARQLYITFIGCQFPPNFLARHDAEFTDEATMVSRRRSRYPRLGNLQPEKDKQGTGKCRDDSFFGISKTRRIYWENTSCRITYLLTNTSRPSVLLLLKKFSVALCMDWNQKQKRKRKRKLVCQFVIGAPRKFCGFTPRVDELFLFPCKATSLPRTRLSLPCFPAFVQSFSVG
jgi:hypothetical protein